MSEQLSENRGKHAALILAGGDGTRLRSLTRRISGADIPKQFCSVLGDATLLDQTYRRVSLSIPPRRTVTVVTRTHERFYAPLLSGIPKSNLVVQPQNRGTASAILYGLLRLAKTAPTATVAVFPSDHYVDSDTQFMHQVDLALEAITTRSDRVVLLGVAPDAPEADYGWIEVGPAISEVPLLFSVTRFWEKPSRDLALRLREEGCFWNTFVLVARIRTLLMLIMRALPSLYASFARLEGTLMTSAEKIVVDRIYDQIPSVNFSQEVLQKDVQYLALYPVHNVKWSDLGDPRRVFAVLEWAGIRPQWSA
jgi:mannose-1-phosphate guanylyltransferase